MYWHDGMGMAGWWGIGVGMVLFWGLVIVGIVLLVRWAGGWNRHEQVPPPPGPPPAAPAPPDQAQRLLDERFARGEIDEDEYRRRREVLRGG